MRLPDEERFAIVSTMSRLDAVKVLSVRHEQGWELIGFATRELDLVMVFERKQRVNDTIVAKWVVKLKRLLKGGRDV